jgi:hypothetical protein
MQTNTAAVNDVDIVGIMEHFTVLCSLGAKGLSLPRTTAAAAAAAAAEKQWLTVHKHAPKTRICMHLDL